MGIAQMNRDRQQAQAGNVGQGTESDMGPRGLTTFIGEGVEFEGTLYARETLRIDGRIRGEIKSDNTVVIGQGADVEANVTSKNVIIIGALAGNVDASRQLVVNKSGRLKGNVATPSLVIEPGAMFNGRTKMVRPEVAAQVNQAAASANPEAASAPAAAASQAKSPKAGERTVAATRKSWRTGSSTPTPPTA